MARPTRWRHLIPGLATLVVVSGAVIAVLLFAQVGRLKGETMRLYAPTSQGRGVIKGTEVWVSGQKVGVVDDVHFRPASVDTSARVVLALDVLTDVEAQIRRDSYAQIRIGGTLIGAPVVVITPGSTGAAHLSDEDTLQTRPQSDVEGVTSQLAFASQDFAALLTNFRLIVAQLDSARGSAGAILSLDGRSRELALFQAGTEQLTQRVTAGGGTLGLALRGGDLTARARHAAAQADSIRALVASESTALGRFRRDSTLLRTVSEVRNELSITRALLAEPRGTAGRTGADSAIVRQLARLEAELGALIRDAKRRPLRYIAF
jgi:ABC-type transporter Mla subunit MlaD